MTRTGGRKNPAAANRVLKEKPVSHGKKAVTKHNRRKNAKSATTTAPKPPSDQVNLSPEDTRPSISKDFIKGLPLRHWDGETKLLQTKQEMETAVSEIIGKMMNTRGGGGSCCLGIDIECKPVFRKHQFQPPALLQIATSDTVYIFRLCELHGKRTPNSKLPHNPKTFAFLLPLLTDSRFIKAGVGVSGDTKLLQSLVKFKPAGFCELAEMAKKSIRSLGLQALAAHFLKVQVSKSRSIALSNWTMPLTDSQIQYAATDAWLGRVLWIAIQEQEHEKKSMEEPADSPSSVFLDR